MKSGFSASMYARMQANSQPFNADFIKLRDKDNPQFYLEAMCRVLEIIDGIKFKGCEIITDEYEIWTKHVKPVTLETGESRYNLAILKFFIEHKTAQLGYQSQEVELKLLIPKLVDKFFFKIRGINYAAIYQIVDKGFYVTKNSCVIKTLSMPIVASFNNITRVNVTTINKKGELVSGNLSPQQFVSLKIFKKEINPYIFLFAKYGFAEGMIKSEINNIVTLMDISDFKEDECLNSNTLICKLLGNYVIMVDKAALKAEPHKTKAVFTFLHLFKSLKRGLFNVHKIETWKTMLGKHFTTNLDKALEKSVGTLKSFERTMDDITKDSLSFVPLEYKKTSYDLLVWLMQNIDNLKRNDNFSIYNKRIRFYEYIFYSLQLKFYTATNRNLSNGRSNTFNSKRRIFSNIHINHIIKLLLTTNLHRYDNCVSGLDLYSAGLKYSNRGPQTMANDDIPIEFRDIHPSFLGILDLYTKSSSDPGMQGTFTPFLSEIKGMLFSNELHITEEDELLM